MRFNIVILVSMLWSSNLLAQQNTAQMFHWPTVAPDGTVRTSGTQTSEDWWYDLKRIPQGHPAYSGQGKLAACGYSIYANANYFYNPTNSAPAFYDVTNVPCNYWISLRDQYSDVKKCELEFLGFNHATTPIGIVGFVDPNDATYTNEHTYNYITGEFKKILPTPDGGFVVCGWTKNTNIPKPNVPAASPNIPPALFNQPIPYYNMENGVVLSHNFTDNSCTNIPLARQSPFFGQAFVMKIDYKGTMEWVKLYGSLNFSGDAGLEAYINFGIVTDIELKPNGDGYYILGGKEVVFLADIDLNGVPRWIEQMGTRTPPPSGVNNVGWRDMAVRANPGGGNIIYTVGESFDEQSTLTKITDQNGVRTVSTPQIFSTVNRSSPFDICRSIALMQDNRLAVGWLSDCVNNGANGDCVQSFVSYFSEANGAFTEAIRIPLGPSISYDMNPGVSLAPLNYGGVAVLGVKKLFHTDIQQPVSGLDYSPCNMEYPSYFTDAYVALIRDDGAIRWSTTFDAWSASPAPNAPNTIAGDPTSSANVNSWINAGVYDMNGNFISNDNFRYDIRKEECLYRLTTDEQGRLLAVGNNGANLDDSYIAVVENTCNLVLNNHVIENIQRWKGCNTPPFYRCPNGFLTYAPEYIATNITLGREAGNTAELARFKVEQDANVKITAGAQVTMKSGTSLKPGANGSVSVKLNPAHSCTAGPVYSLD